MSTLVSTTCSEDGTITTFALAQGGLQPLAASPVGDGVNCLAPDASGRHAYAGTKEPTGVAVLDLDVESGRWSVVDRAPADDSLTYLQVSQDQRWLLGVSYGGGWGQVWPIRDGRLGEPTDRIEFQNLHCIVELDGFAYAVSLGEDLVACYRLTGEGRLQPLETPTVAAPQGSGPRHLAVGDGGRNLYLVTEFSGEVVRLERDTTSGVLTAREKVGIFDPSRGLKHSRIGADPAAEHLIWGADVHLAQGFLVASERCESTLTTLPLASDGSLGEPLGFVDTEKQPRGFNVTADGTQVICPGEKSDQVSLFTLQPDGSLTDRRRARNGQGSNWVRLLEA